MHSVCCNTSERYCSDFGRYEPSQCLFVCVLRTQGGGVNFELGLSELSCASTGEHAERGASRSRCLKSQDVVFTSGLFNCVFLLVRD